MTYPEYITKIQEIVLNVMGKEISRDRAGRMAKKMLYDHVYRLSSSDVIEFFNLSKGRK